MQEARLNGSSPAGCLFGMCSGGTSYPETYSGGDVQLLMVGYRVLPALQVRALVATPGWVGETTGLGSALAYVTVATRAKSFGALAALDAGGLLWLFAGVSLDHVQVTREYTEESRLASGIRPGAWIGGQLRIPGNKRFFASLTAMRHVSAGVTSDAFTSTEWNSDVTHDVPAFTVNANYTMVGIGFGVNF